MHVRIVAVRFCNIVLKHQEKYQRSPWFVVLRAKMRNESTKERLHSLNTALKYQWDTNRMVGVGFYSENGKIFEF